MLTNLVTFCFSEIPDITAKDSNKLGERFTEIFIKKQENVGLVLDYLEEFDFQVRWPALQLLLLLLTNKCVIHHKQITNK